MNTFKYIKETFDELYGRLSIPVILFDEKGGLIKVNQSFLNLTKASLDDLQKLSMTSFFKDLKISFNKRFFLKVIPEYLATEITDTDGNNTPVRLHYTKLKKGEELYESALGFISDLREINLAKEKIKKLSLEKEEYKEPLTGKTPEKILKEKVRLEKELIDTKVFLENLLESCGDGIYTLGRDGRINLVNESFATMLGKKKEEILGAFPYELGPWGGEFRSTTGETIVLDQSYADYQTSQLNRKHELRDGAGGMIENWEYYVFNKDKKIVPLELTVSIKKNAEGAFTGSVTTARNLTKKRIAEKAVKEAYQFRSQFFTNITHAFRTPLTLTIGPIEGILRGELGKINKDMKEQLSLALKNSRQLLKLIDQLLDFSRLESGKRTFIYEKKDLKNFIAAVLDSFSFIAKKKKINLTFTPVSAIPYVSIDPIKVEKVLFNLIGNAFKFTPKEGSITVTIEDEKGFQGKAYNNEIEITDSGFGLSTPGFKGNYVKIAVLDTGIGIKEDDLKNIFERFKQGSGSFTHKDGGTEIGLAHSKELIEYMGGRITVRSEYGKGSTFSVYLPVERVKTDEGPEAAKETKEGLHLRPEIELSDIHQGKEVIADSITGKKPLILIIDDNPDVRQYVSDIVKKEYDYMTAGSGKEGLKKLEQHQPDVILCDIMMPEMDGHEFLKHVKSHPSLKDISFIFLTARADTEMKIEGLEKGADDYIVKPFNSLELLARVKSLLRIRTLMNRTASQEKKISNLTQKLQGKYFYGNIIGNSPPMRKIYQLLETIKDSAATILIAGETGTGKELIANVIHYNSPRKDGPMISVNCGAIPKELMEREFFGHVKGAYTGAVENRRGYFEEASGGTLFLDEIGALDRDMQVKLLRVLERGEIIRVGDSVPTKIDVRLIVATNKDLRFEIREGNFREDLYYRIYVIPIHIPPLRERREDISLLIEHFLKKDPPEGSDESPSLPEKEMNWLMNYSYPGNVRELEHIIERFCLLGTSAESLLQDLPVGFDKVSEEIQYDEFISSTNPLKRVAQKARLRAERDLIMHTLKICDNDYNEAANMLNIGISSLYRKMKEYKDELTTV